MPSHYALSDAAIVVVTIFAGNILWRHGRGLSAFAMACFGIAAAIGVLRFGGGLQDELAALHSGASQLLGLAGALALVSVCILPPSNRSGTWIIAIILCVATAMLIFARPLIGPFFIVAIVIVIVASILRPHPSRHAWLIPVGSAVMLGNALFIRRAAWFDEAVAWHAYHIVIAIALAALAKGLNSDEKMIGP